MIRELTIILKMIMVLVCVRDNSMLTNASDGCSNSGAVGVCCENGGNGPICAYCEGLCIAGSEGAPCDM